MVDKQILLTKDGFDKLHNELKTLIRKRKDIANDIDEARSKGDLSENAEYDAAKEAQAMNEKKISDIELTLTRAKILDESKMSKDEALLGATVTVEEISGGEKYDYILVNQEEADFDLNKISVTSPVGKALLGHRVNDVISMSVPAGTIKYKITKITR